MTVLFLILTLASSVTQNCIFNKVSKKDLKTSNAVYHFNSLVSLVCVLTFGVLLLKGKLSLFTVLLGVVFGVLTALRNLYSIRALANGPMNITLLITTSSTIIPTLSGAFLGEPFSAGKLVAVFVLLGFIYISLKKDEDSETNRKWLTFALLAFLSQGLVGVLQKVHQTSFHKDETGGFLFVAFVLAFIYNRIMITEKNRALKLKKTTVLFAAICGVCTFCMNYLNLKLAGMLPSQLFFPLVNGGSMLLSQIMSVAIFKEMPSRKQLVGLLGGMCTLIVICVIK